MNNFTSNLVILFPLGFSLYIAMRLSDGQVDGRGRGWARALVYTIASLAVSLSIAGVLFRAGFFSLLWLFFGAGFCLVIWLKGRGINRSLMLHSFASLESNVARERMAVEFEKRNGWFVGARASRFRKALDAGLTWSQAMEKVGIAKTTSEIFACRCLAKFGPEFGKTISPALDPLRIQAETDRLVARLAMLPWFFKGFILVVLTVFLVVPTFKEMFEEFGLELPPVMLAFVALSEITYETPLGILFALTLLLFAFTGFGIALVWTFPRLSVLWPVRWFVSPYYRALGLTSLAMAIRREPDFAKASEVAAELLPVPYLSHNLSHSSALVRKGVAPERAIAAAGILKYHEAEVLATSITAQSFPWALEQLAVSAVERMLRFYSVGIQLLVVLAVLFFAIVFGWLAIGVIEVLSIMIQQLA